MALFHIPKQKLHFSFEVVVRVASQAWKLEQERLKKEELDKKSKKESKGKGQKKTEDDKSSDKKRKAPTGEKMSKPDKRGSSAKIPTGSAISIASSDAEKGGLQTEEPDNVKKHTEKWKSLNMKALCPPPANK